MEMLCALARRHTSVLLVLLFIGLCMCVHRAVAASFEEPRLPGVASTAVVLGEDRDGDGDPDEVQIHLEVVEVQEEVYPGKRITFWVFAPVGEGMTSVARVPSPTIRVEEGDLVKIILHNTHYFPHTIHLHGTIHPNAMDGVPDVTQAAVQPGEAFTYTFTAQNPGTHFYHCHVQPDVHVLMGLAGMFIIEPNRPQNTFSHLLLGAGRIPDLSRAAIEQGYQREYSLVYMDIDERLNDLLDASDDPRELEIRMHRTYDSTKRQPDIFLLNGRSFPYTLRDTPIVVRPDEKVKLRILNAGARTLSLHTHGHHPLLTHLDGYAVPPSMHYARDVFTIGPAQRVDLELYTTPNAHDASGPGVWLMHDHTEQAVTNKGISPGGDLTAIVYEAFMGPDGLPRTAMSLERFFNPDYYAGKLPIFDPAIFHATLHDYPQLADGKASERTSPISGAAAPETPRRLVPHQHVHSERLHILEEHRPIAHSCALPRDFRQVILHEGTQVARAGEVYGFTPREVHVGRCEEVEVVLENTDAIRHALMIPGLNPMFMLEFQGPGVRIGRFITPDEDITLPFHCHVPTHAKMGMEGVFIVGKGGASTDKTVTATAPTHFQGVGTVIFVDARKGQLVVDHEEIPGFMAAMIMGYPVQSPMLLHDLTAGDRIRFTIDAHLQVITQITKADKGSSKIQD
jgi:FtsP/CotA-like multicopper oxidase with cupredoxin domain/Cu/Ag efflux protein CusF